MERPHLDTACPTVLYDRFLAHMEGCRPCSLHGWCETGRALLKAYGDAESRETTLQDDADRAIQDTEPA